MIKRFKHHIIPAVLLLLTIVVASPVFAANVEIVEGEESRGVPMVFGDLQTTVFGEPAANPADTRIVVVTHGDSGKADYMLGIAEELGAPGVIAIGLARPGCWIEGRKSKGSHNYKKGDHYTRGNIEAVAESLELMKEYYKTDHIFLIGHSGGAATAALVAGKYPTILEGAIMVSLPANVKKWRRHRGRGNWKKSISPHNYVEDLSPDAKLVVVVGEDDSNTPPWLGQMYVDDAAEEGKTVTLIVVPGSGHNFKGSSDPKTKTVLQEVQKML